MNINVSAEAAAIAAKFDQHWGAFVRTIIKHPRMAVLIAFGAGALAGAIGAVAL